MPVELLGEAFAAAGAGFVVRSASRGWDGLAISKVAKTELRLKAIATASLAGMDLPY